MKDFANLAGSISLRFRLPMVWMQKVYQNHNQIHFEFQTCPRKKMTPIIAEQWGIVLLHSMIV
mgnify:CR=1 FL=1